MEVALKESPTLPNASFTIFASASLLAPHTESLALYLLLETAVACYADAASPLCPGPFSPYSLCWCWRLLLKWCERKTLLAG